MPKFFRSTLLASAIAFMSAVVAGCGGTSYAREQIANASVLQDLEAVNDQFNAAAAAYDMEKFLSLYSKSALWIAPATPPVAGHDEPRAMFQFLADNQGTLTHTVDQLFVSQDGTLAVMIGTADVLMESAEIDADGTYLFVLERDGENWQIAADMWHQHRE